MKTLTTRPITLLLCILLLFAASAPPVLAAEEAALPRSLLSTTASLTVRSNGDLNKYFRASSTSRITIFYVATLQQKKDGKWETYSIDSGMTTTGIIVYSEDEEPERGYKYRLQVETLSEGFGTITFYSKEQSY